MRPQVKLCPVCKQPLEPGDYVASKYPKGYKRRITEYVPKKEGEMFGTWVYAGNTMSNTHYFRCRKCGKNVQIETFERITKVKD